MSLKLIMYMKFVIIRRVPKSVSLDILSYINFDFPLKRNHITLPPCRLKRPRLPL